VPLRSPHFSESNGILFVKFGRVDIFISILQDYTISCQIFNYFLRIWLAVDRDDVMMTSETNCSDGKTFYTKLVENYLIYLHNNLIWNRSTEMNKIWIIPYKIWNLRCEILLAPWIKRCEIGRDWKISTRGTTFVLKPKQSEIVLVVESTS